MNHRSVPVPDPIRQALTNLVNAVLAETPDYPGAHVYRDRILHTLAHKGRELLRAERYDGRRVP